MAFKQSNNLNAIWKAISPLCKNWAEGRGFETPSNLEISRTTLVVTQRRLKLHWVFSKFPKELKDVPLACTKGIEKLSYAQNFPRTFHVTLSHTADLDVFFQNLINLANGNPKFSIQCINSIINSLRFFDALSLSKHISISGINWPTSTVFERM